MFIRFALPFRVSRKGFCFGPLSFARESEGKKRLAALTVLRESFLPSPVFDLGAVLHADEDRHCLTDYSTYCTREPGREEAFAVLVTRHSVLQCSVPVILVALRQR